MCPQLLSAVFPYKTFYSILALNSYVQTLYCLKLYRTPKHKNFFNLFFTVYRSKDFAQVKLTRSIISKGIPS